MEHCHLTFIALHKFILTSRLVHFHRLAGNGLYCAFQNMKSWNQITHWLNFKY